MIESPSPPHTVVAMEELAPRGSVVTSNIQGPQPSRPLKQKNSHQSTPIFPTLLRTPSASGGFLSNFMQRSLTRRQIAEIQLDGLLNDPEEAMPTYTRRASDRMFADAEMTIENVSKLLNTQSFVIERLLHALNLSSKENPATAMSKSDVQKLTRVLNGSMDVRALIFFLTLDETGNDYVTRDGLTEFCERYLGGIPSFDKNRLQGVIEVLLQKFHLNTKSRIDFDEFYTIVAKDRTLLETLSQFTVHPTWFVSPALAPSPPNRIQRFFNRLCWQQTLYEQHRKKLTIDYVRDNFSRIILFTFYLLTNIGLMLWVVIYRTKVTNSHVLEILARIGGMLLNFNCAFIIVLMLKQTILLIRSNRILRKLIPVDDHIDFHKIVGRVITALVILHTIAHMANFGRRREHSWGAFMFTTYPDIGWVGGFAPISGIILCVILAIIVIFSMQWIRRGGHFQIFYWTHLLYIPFFAFLIVHASNFWKWVVGPLSIFLLEKLYSILTRYSSSSGRTYLNSATIEQSNVISLTIHRPKNFNFRPGDYITINLPRVALYEFHPFTISSAPEESENLRIHIQASGNWTKQVYQRFKAMSEGNAEDSHVKVFRADLHPEISIIEEMRTDERRLSEVTSDVEEETNISTITKIKSKSGKKEPIFVNGPYSSCARYVFDCKHVVLIGGGIGITPYASILSSLMAQFRASRTVCKHCHGINYSHKGLAANHRLKKVDFIWVNRDQKNFEWFLNLLRQFEQEQEAYLSSNENEKRFLDIHLYFTEIKHDENIGNVPLDLVRKVWAEVAGQDIFTSLKSKTHIGRPDWGSIFNGLMSGDNASTANDVNVFFCGPPTMAKSIKNYCQKFRFRFYEEKF